LPDDRLKMSKSGRGCESDAATAEPK